MPVNVATVARAAVGTTPVPRALEELADRADEQTLEDGIPDDERHAEGLLEGDDETEDERADHAADRRSMQPSCGFWAATNQPTAPKTRTRANRPNVFMMTSSMVTRPVSTGPAVTASCTCPGAAAASPRCPPRPAGRTRRCRGWSRPRSLEAGVTGLGVLLESVECRVAGHRVLRMVWRGGDPRRRSPIQSCRGAPRVPGARHLWATIGAGDCLRRPRP